MATRMASGARIRLRSCLWGLASLATACYACGRTDVAGQRTAADPPSSAGRARLVTRPCVYHATGYRCCVNPPDVEHRVEPDLSGLPPIAEGQLAIIEVRIDAKGRVTDECLLRGVRADVDRKALEAVGEWRFEPPRLLSDTTIATPPLKAGTAVPIFMTVTVPVRAR
jgi:TonB family protein